MSPESPILETDHKNVTLTCEVVSGNPSILDEVIWYLDGEVLKHLPECNGTDGMYFVDILSLKRKLCDQCNYYFYHIDFYFLRNSIQGLHG